MSPLPTIPNVLENPELINKPLPEPKREEKCPSPFPTIPDVNDEILKVGSAQRISRSVSPFPRDDLVLSNLAINPPEKVVLQDITNVINNQKNVGKKATKLEPKLINLKQVEYSNFNTIPSPFSPLRLNFGRTKPTDIRRTLTLDEPPTVKDISNISLPDLSKLSEVPKLSDLPLLPVASNNEPKLSDLPTLPNVTSKVPKIISLPKLNKPISEMDNIFPSRPISPYPVYIPISSRSGTPNTKNEAVENIMNMVTTIQGKKKADETKSDLHQISQADLEVEKSFDELTKEQLVETQIVETSVDKNLEMKKQTFKPIETSETVKCSKAPESVIGGRPIFGQTDINKELRKAFGLNKPTPVKQQTPQKPQVAKPSTKQISEIVRKSDLAPLEIPAQTTAEPLNSLEYQTPPIKSLINSFEKSSMPVMKYKQIREAPAEMIMNLLPQAQNQYQSNEQKIKIDTDPNKNFYVASSSVKTKLFLPTEMESNTISDTRSQSQSETLISSSTSKFTSSESSSFVKVQQSHGQQLIEGKITVWFLFACFVCHIFGIIMYCCIFIF